MIVAVPCAFPQDPGQLVTALRAQDGYLAVDEAHTKLTATGFKKGNDELLRTLIHDVNAVLKTIGRLCNQALKVEISEPCPDTAREISRITTPDWATLRKRWDAWRQGQSDGGVTIDLVVSANSTPIISLDKALSAITGLSFDANDDTVDSGSGRLTFALRPAVGDWTFANPPGDGKEPVIRKNTSAGPPLVDDARLLQSLAPFTGGLWRRAAIENRVQRLYPKDRVLRALTYNNDAPDVIFSVKADPWQRRFEIVEGVRLTSIELAPSVSDSSVRRAYYLLLSYSEFLAQEGKRQKVYPANALPLVDTTLVGRLAGLSTIGLTVEKFFGVKEGDEIKPGVRLLSIVPTGATSIPNLKTDTQPVWGWVTVEFGGRYQPAQSISGTVGVTLQKFGEKPQSFAFRTGATGAGAIGEFSYTNDFALFDYLHRRLTLNARGGTETQFHRVLQGVAADERRLSATARGDLELIPDRTGTFLGAWVEVERTSVIVQRANRPDETVKFAGINAGGTFSKLTGGLGLRRTFSISPKLQTGLPIADSFADFRLGTLTASYAQELGKGIEIHVSGQGAAATSGTPLVQQIVLGGAETVRGYRRDEAIGRRFWKLQNEVWFTPSFRSDASWLDWVRQNMKLALFFDVGGLYQAAQGGSGVRKGVGGGVRVRPQPRLYLRVDYGYGLDAVPNSRKGRIYISADLGF